MAKPKASITVKQHISGSIVRYKVVTMTNFTDHVVGDYIKKDTLDALIREGITVNIK